MRQVVHDVRMPEIELPSCRVVTIPLFGNRQRHHPGFGRAQSRLDLFALIAQEQNLANAADDSTAYAGRAFFHRGIYAALRREPVANIRGAQAHAANPPVALIERKCIVAEYCCLRPVKRTDAEMNNTDSDAARVVGWPGDRGRQRRQRAQRKPPHAGLFVRKASEARSARRPPAAIRPSVDPRFAGPLALWLMPSASFDDLCKAIIYVSSSRRDSQFL